MNFILIFAIQILNAKIMAEKMYIPSMEEIKKFAKLTEYFTQPFAHRIVVADAYNIANRMYDGVMMHKEFLAYINKDNSIEDIRTLFNEIAESWIFGELIHTEKDDDLYEYNLMTGEIGDIIKDDVFECLIKEIRQ